MLVHIVALLAMALVVTPAPEKEKPRVITSSAPEVEENFEEPLEEPLEEQPDITEVADVVMPTDVAVVEDVKVIANADDLDAAPLAVELTDFGSETAPAAGPNSASTGPGRAGLGAGASRWAVAARPARSAPCRRSSRPRGPCWPSTAPTPTTARSTGP